MLENRENWAGNYTYGATALHAPETVAEVQALVRHAGKVRALGSRHSFNAIANSPGTLISLARFDHTPVVDATRRTVTIDGGSRYGQFSGALHQAGFALHNLASLPHISVAGACATATHGSGVAHGNLATAVTALDVVTAGGTLRHISREDDPEELAGAVVGLGGLGVVTSLTLDVVPAFDVRQEVYENLPLAQLDAHFDAIMGAAYSVSLFAGWQDARIQMVWVKHRVQPGPPSAPPGDFFGATPAPADRHPIIRLSAESCTPQMGVPGPWHERLPHFRMDFTPSAGDELQTEYFVPYEHGLDAIHAIFALGPRIAPLLHVSEVRTVAADDLWMSPCYRQASVAIHFTWKKDWKAVQRLLPAIEAALAPWNPRPHWGKLFTLPPAAVQACYPRLPDFRRLLQTYDPAGKFRNAFLDRYIFGPA